MGRERIPTMRLPPGTSYRLIVLQDKVRSCTNCVYSQHSNRKILERKIGSGSIQILFVGEAPGMTEYIQQKPFVGESGNLLTRLIENAFPPGITYGIANAIACTPFTNISRSHIETPCKDSLKECRKVWLSQYIKIIRPEKIIALGNVAASTLKAMKVPYTQVLHPSAILRDDKHQEYQEKRFILALQSVVETLT